LTQLSYCPSVVLLVDETGGEVHRHLGAIMDLTGPLGAGAAGIALLRVEVGGTGMPECWPVPLTGAGGEAEPAEPLAFGLRRAVARVRDMISLDALRTAGYTIAADVHVMVVAAVDDPWLGRVAGIARYELEELRQPATICCLLDGTPRQPAGDDRVASVWEHPVDFSFLFTDRIDYPSPEYVTDAALRRYALAEALFTLIATGLPLDSSFMQLLRRRSSAETVRVGSLRTCLVTFPRGAVGRYCAAGLGMEVVEMWRQTLGGAPVDPAEATQERRLAERAMREIREWLEDTAVRPGTDPGRTHGAARHLWPSLAILRAGSADTAAGDPGRRAHQQLLEATERLFGLFVHADVDREVRDRPTHDWADVAHERSSRAPEVFHTWQRTAQATWTLLPDLLLDHLRAAVNRRWASGDRRLALLRSFVEECDRQLTHLVVANAGLREQHVQRYRARGAEYRELAGRWWRELDQPALGDAGSGGPTWADRAEGLPGSRTDPTAPAPGPEERPPDRRPDAGEPLGTHLTPREEGIARALRDRAETMHAMVPTWRAALSSALLAFAGIGLPALSLLLTWLSAPRVPLALLAGACGGSAILGILAHAGLRAWRRRSARRAETDLLRFLCLCFAHRCERREDRFRVQMLGPVRWWVQHTLHLLEEVDPFFDAVHSVMDQTAEETVRALFETPTGRLDLLVARGGQLRPPDAGASGGPDDFTLDDILQETKRRWGPEAEPRSLSDAFLATIRDVLGLLEMEPAELRDRMIAFVGGRLDETVLKELSREVYRALRRPEIQRRAELRLQSPLVVLRGMMQPRDRYVCGRPPTGDVTGLPAGRLVMGTQDEWWALACLFADGAGSTLDVTVSERLFVGGTGN
jgi:hypothetical protein